MNSTTTSNRTAVLKKAHAKYFEKNKVNLQSKMAIYYQEHKESIKQRRKERYYAKKSATIVSKDMMNNHIPTNSKQ